MSDRWVARTGRKAGDAGVEVAASRKASMAAAASGERPGSFAA